VTVFTPLKYAGVKAGDKVAIIGLGGLGHCAVKFAAAMGAQVTVISTSASVCCIFQVVCFFFFP
jgi:uncharacterized zinc-type alcohol dehydrogenase-like protein